MPAPCFLAPVVEEENVPVFTREVGEEMQT
jgi:hypothetical protein